MDDPKKNLKICIIGAGIAGLTSALALKKEGFENVEVYETASNLGFVGAGIQLAPNMSRILDRLGVWKEIEKEAVELKTTSIREGSTDEELGHVDLGYIRETYGYPHMVGHRHSLTQGLYNGCKKYPNLLFHFSTKIVEIHSFSPKPTFTILPRGEEPRKIKCDILLACDGIKSMVREKMLGELGVDAKVVDSEQAAYRILLKREQMEGDPELLELINTSSVNRWIGTRRHIIAYPISNKTIYNISTTQPDVNFSIAPSETYTTKGSKSTMLSTFSDFCPKVRKLLNLVPEGEVCEWKLRLHAPLPTWVYGGMALVGDACHPTLPHLAQGAAQAVEDAAVLAICLSNLANLNLSNPNSPSPSKNINLTLEIYEKIRKSRAETIVELAADSARTLHLGDGDADGKKKEERNKLFKELREGKGGGKVPDKWADRSVQELVYGVDCGGVARERWGEFWEGGCYGCGGEGRLCV